MNIQRTIAIRLDTNTDLRAMLAAFREGQQQLSPVCYNVGTVLKAIGLHHAMYDQVKGTLSTHITCIAILLVADVYASAKRNQKPATRPFYFKQRIALFLAITRGRDASFRNHGATSTWTNAGHKRVGYTVPNTFKQQLEQAIELDSLLVIGHNRRLLDRAAVSRP